MTNSDTAGAPDHASGRERILGVSFFNGTATTAVEAAMSSRGCVVIPAAPALLKLNYDEAYRHAMQQADLVVPDSGLLTKLWKIKAGTDLAKVSGIEYLRRLVQSDAFKKEDNVLWVLPSDTAKQKAFEFLRARQVAVSDSHFHVLGRPSASGQDHGLLLQIEERRPEHVVVALRGGGQEELGIYLRDYLLYRPTIHCVGAALGFLTGDEEAIPEWAQKRQLGWLSRLVTQPGMIVPRIGIAVALAAMVFRYGSELPPLRTRWADL